MPFDETTGGRGIYRPKTRSKPPPSRIDNICRVLRQNRLRLGKIGNNRHATVRVLSESRLEANAPVGVEGELATDGVSRFWVYLDGEWTPTQCYGTPSALGTALICGYGVDEDFEDVYLVPFGQDAFAVTNVDQEGYYEYYRVMWYNGKIIAIYYSWEGGGIDYVQMDPSGSNQTLLYHVDDNVYFETRMVIADSGDLLLSYTSSNNLQWKLVNLTTGTLLHTLTPSMFGPYNNFFEGVVSHSGEQVVLGLDDWPDNHRPFFRCNVDGTGIVGPLGSFPPHGNYGSTPSWAPNDSYFIWRPYPNYKDVGYMNLGGGAQEIIYEGPTGSTPGYIMFSPDATKIGFHQYLNISGGENRITVLDATSPTFDVLNSFLYSTPEFTSINMSWGPDSDHMIAVGIEEYAIIDFIQTSTGTVDRIYEGSSPLQYPNAPHWTDRRMIPGL